MLNLIELPQFSWLRPVSTFDQHEGTNSTPPVEEKPLSAIWDSPDLATPIRNIVTDMLATCQVPYSILPYNQELHDLCIEECLRKGYPLDRNGLEYSIEKYIASGIYMSPAYKHLPNIATKAWIAIFTAFASCIDDVMTMENVSHLEVFGQRLISGQQQANPLLDGFARLLKEIPDHWRGLQGDIILGSSISFVAGCIIEIQTEGEQPSVHARRYPTFYRVLSGVSEAYSMFIWPPEVPFQNFIQSVPEISMYINCMNDVLSFYKEEMKGETVNYITLQAESRGKPKLLILQQLAQDVATCHNRAVCMLEEKDSKTNYPASIPTARASYHDSFTSDHWRGLQGDIILSSSINYMSACMIEIQTEGEQPSVHARRYPTFYRVLSGICESYSMFIWPPEVPFQNFIQSVPEISMFINCMNDVLSFYKEEIRGETVNYVTLQAESRGEPKLSILQQLAQDVATCHNRAVCMLEEKDSKTSYPSSIPTARGSYQGFAVGYVSFHASYVKRYRLNELGSGW
ncbi:hypothetical protein CVT24_008772 [Panaeolus cyanescens]|uniref:Terpene synthase n=1 Tax=Panaeolus cyanescens TaxID=181874 RepID=A0A409VB39_9AGAR|nr:hypothetical protein CVT24_008772 [Panaeolus cyanescens]